MKRLTCGVIIPTRNRLSDLIPCLESIAQQTVRPDEIVIVDASDLPMQQDSSFQELFSKENFLHTELLYTYSVKRGAAYQRNVGMGLGRSDIFHFLDDDVILEPSYIEQMQKIFAARPDYAGGMGTVTNLPPLKKNLFWAIKKLFGLQRIYESGGFTWAGMPLHAYGTNELREVEVLGGCCMAFRAAVCKKQLFDEHLGQYSYMEDADLSWRVSREHTLFYNPRARLAHMVSPQARDKVADTRALYIRNYSYLFFKNIYKTKRIKVFAYCWAVFGLFFEAALLRNGSYFKGYCKGLWQFLRKK